MFGHQKLTAGGSRQTGSPRVSPDTSPPVSTLKGVGPRILERLQRLHIHTVQDMLFHLPVRYQDRTRLRPISSLRPGDESMVIGEVEHSEIVYRRRRMLLVRLCDGSVSPACLTLRFFHFNRAQRERLAGGTLLRCYGEVRKGIKGLEMIHPEYIIQPRGEPVKVENSLTPIYPTTEGLHQINLRSLTAQSLRWLCNAREFDREGIELLPRLPEIDGRKITIREALTYIHRPPVDADIKLLLEGKHVTQRRLAHEELLAHQLSLSKIKMQMQRQAANVIAPPGKHYSRLLEKLGFNLTGAQRRVIGEVFSDLQKPHPMLRLVQGDVGSGKTLIAIAACLQAVEAGYQAVMMAPTEILAEQHLQNFGNWLARIDTAPFGGTLHLACLSGKLNATQSRQMKERIASGDAGIVLGTHALFQQGVHFKNLALVIVDEQHRFGVHQRLALREKGSDTAGGSVAPHQLIMTATPIPRTLAMTAYADLDYSVIDELPPGRKPVETIAVPREKRQQVIERVASACRSGQQAYWVCTLVEESEAIQCQAAMDVHQALHRQLHGVRVGLLHGRMKGREKDVVMQDFLQCRIDLLVATTVIEVGVNVTNASLMVIENAERLGLAQLHQLRGRVGRGKRQSSCVLLYNPPLTDHARLRIDTLRTTNDGFRIAQVDMQLRGPGEMLGTRQTGALQFRIADIMRDHDLIPAVQQTAAYLLANHPQVVDALVQRWLGKSIEFGQV